MPATYDPSTVPGIVNTLVLAAPDGTLYDVRDLDEVVNVAAWQAGTTQAELQDGRMLDLRTGVIGADRRYIMVVQSLQPADDATARDTITRAVKTIFPEGRIDAPRHGL